MQGVHIIKAHMCWCLCGLQLQAGRVTSTVKPPLVDSPNKGHLRLSGQHDMHGLNFSIQMNLPAKDMTI